MKPFEDDFRDQLKRKWGKTHQKLGLTWDDLEGVPAGEVSIAVIEPSKGDHALALLIDVTGHEQQANSPDRKGLQEPALARRQAEPARRRRRQDHAV